jgi:hypothetical protein
MGTFAQALSNLAALAVPGVTSYALADAPARLSGAQLPALLILPELSGEAPGLEPNRFSPGNGRITVQIVHALLLAPVSAGLGARGSYPALAALVDAYLTTLAADPTLGGALAVPLRAHLRWGVLRYGDLDCFGASFAHSWILQI